MHPRHSQDPAAAAEQSLPMPIGSQTQGGPHVYGRECASARPGKLSSAGLVGRRTLVRRMDSSSSARHEDATLESSEWNVAESSLDRTSEDTSTWREAENVMTASVRLVGQIFNPRLS